MSSSKIVVADTSHGISDPTLAWRKPLSPQALHVGELGGEEALVGTDWSEGKFWSLETRIVWDERKQLYRISWRDQERNARVSIDYVPLNLLEVRVLSSVSIAGDAKLRYSYVACNNPGSRQNLTLVVLGCALECFAKEQIKTLERYYVAEHASDSASSTFLALARPGATPAPIGAAEIWDGIGYKCEWLPTLVRCYAKGYAPPIESEAELPEFVSKFLPPGVNKLGLEGWTVGPGHPWPRNLEEIQQIVSKFNGYLSAGRTAGWVAPGLCLTALEGMITASVDAVGREDRPAAVAALRQLAETVRQMAAADPPTVTSEMVALLALNASVLADTLERMSK